MRFAATASHPKHAVALIYDLEGFSKFFNQPDVHEYVPRFLNHVSEALNRVFLGGEAYWDSRVSQMRPLLAPIHEKFLGDGMLYLWTPPPGQSSFGENFLPALCNRLWNLKLHFNAVIKNAADDVPVLEVPDRIRFGIARGTIYELSTEAGRRKEYVGFCINLASRLQNYCPNLGFIASARVGIPKATLKKHGYVSVVATRIKGFPREIVNVEEREYADLDETVRAEMFEEI
jgi:class 3 adenylate cyclase